MSKTKKSVNSSEDASSSSGTSSSLSSDEEIGSQGVKPIKEYLSDRKELAHQLFKSVKAEKIQMMLPQALKKMDFTQLETWCANELSGMSKSRILCILNGRPMLDSSDTSESDNSGPSLEIISDTEEWFTDEDMCKQEDGLKSGKGKKSKVKQKGKIQINKKNEGKQNSHKISNHVYKNVQVKKEEETSKIKEKEGDSLLDLLELEMRARAIRALIRKEEDAIPDVSKVPGDNENTKEKSSTKAQQDEIKEKENCRRQLEKIISAQQNNSPEDEDVVLVVQPTPTIELLSSDSEGDSHGGVRVNKKLENERVIDSKDNFNHVANREAKISDSNNDLKKDETTKTNTESEKETNTSHIPDSDKRTHNNNEVHKDSHKRRKTKKKSHTKEQAKDAPQDSSNCKNGNQAEKSLKSESTLKTKLDEIENQDCVKSKIPRNESPSNVQISNETGAKDLDEEKSIDMDEIIDLDNYCDDMDDMVNSENDKTDQPAKEKKYKVEKEANNTLQKNNGTETWASRYYQTDDVQNVIKESKIQSEIRKRLRERQRLSKLTTSPSERSPSSPPTIETSVNKSMENNPMGSVDEYLALKNISATNHSNKHGNNVASVIKNNVAMDIINSGGNENVSAVQFNMQKTNKEVVSNGSRISDNTTLSKADIVINKVNVTNPS